MTGRMTDISCIELDTSIQCRASIDTALVNEYAERMGEGDKFPVVVLFGTNGRYWIGDGWHRIMAAKQVGQKNIAADLKPGGRVEALKFALGANAAHGHRRSNADKRRCVEIALKEFSSMSSRSIAEMCGVGDRFVRDLRGVDELGAVKPHVTGKDGKQYAARIKPNPRSGVSNEPPPQRRRPVGPPCDGMNFAHLAIRQLEQIRADDIERQQAFNHVKQWIEDHETQT